MRHRRRRNVEVHGAVLPPFYWYAMTEPFRLTEGDEEDIFELPLRPRTDSWIDRVRAADAEAEGCWENAESFDEFNEATLVAYVRAIASELRAARIARRPGAGQ